jgi:hypothetical protein
MPAYFQLEEDNLLYRKVLSENNIDLLQKELETQLKNVHPMSLPIVVRRNIIKDVAKQMLEKNKYHHIGDMFSRYHQNRDIDRCDWKYLNQKIINYIKKEVMAKLEIDYQYSTFSIWKSETEGNKNRYSTGNIKINENKIKSAGYEGRF